MKKYLWLALGLFLATAFLATGAQAQVPTDIEAALVKMGHVVDPGCTAKLYRSMMPTKDIDYQLAEMQKTGKPSTQVTIYPGVTVVRDQSFGPNPKDVIDIFTADKGGGNRPVLIYVPGGAGNKIELQDREANAFYDNIARWATENGMVGVLMQRHGAAPAAPGTPPDFYAGAKDVSAMLQWVEANIAQYKGNPNHMFLWAQSAGNGPTGIYIGHPELYGPKGVGVKGVVFMSGQFSILRPDGTNPMPAPAARGGAVAGGAPGGAAPAAAAAPNPLGGASPCGLTGGANSVEGVLPGRTPDQPGGQAAPAARGGGGAGAGGAGGGAAAARGPGGAPGGQGAPGAGAAAGGPGGAGGGRGPQISQEEQIKRSSLPELEKTSVKVLLASGELDIGLGPDGGLSTFNQTLHKELCSLDGPKAVDGKGHCPTVLFEKGESHMSEVFSIDTPDKNVSGPILKWLKSIK